MNNLAHSETNIVTVGAEKLKKWQKIFNPQFPRPKPRIKSSDYAYGVKEDLVLHVNLQLASVQVDQKLDKELHNRVDVRRGARLDDQELLKMVSKLLNKLRHLWIKAKLNQSTAACRMFEEPELLSLWNFGWWSLGIALYQCLCQKWHLGNRWVWLPTCYLLWLGLQSVPRHRWHPYHCPPSLYNPLAVGFSSKFPNQLKLVCFLVVALFMKCAIKNEKTHRSSRAGCPKFEMLNKIWINLQAEHLFGKNFWNVCWLQTCWKINGRW